jgi:hypothetical protein
MQAMQLDVPGTKLRRVERPVPAPGPGGGASRRPALDPHLRACENLVHVLMNHHDFVTIR